MNPWDKIFEHQFTEALAIADKNYQANGDVFDFRARGTSHLLLENYNAALQDFLEILDDEQKSGNTGDDIYLDIGLCYYALADYSQAKEYFKFPVAYPGKIKYTSGIFRPSSILCFSTELKRYHYFQ